MNPCGTRAFTNIVSSDDPSTISGDAIARKITKFMAPDPGTGTGRAPGR